MTGAQSDQKQNEPNCLQWNQGHLPGSKNQTQCENSTSGNRRLWENYNHQANEGKIFDNFKDCKNLGHCTNFLLQILHMKGFSEEELNFYTHAVQDNLVESVVVLVRALEQLGLVYQKVVNNFCHFAPDFFFVVVVVNVLFL